jgi:stress-induced morphogen
LFLCVVRLGGCGAFFRVLVVSPAFTGLSLVKQHRLVNQTLKPHIANLHGLTLTTFTEEQWQAEQKRSS